MRANAIALDAIVLSHQLGVIYARARYCISHPLSLYQNREMQKGYCIKIILMRGRYCISHRYLLHHDREMQKGYCIKIM
jgi:hypothetical protein